MLDIAALPLSMQPLLFAFSCCFTKPSYQNFLTLVLGWIACQGCHSISRVIQAAYSSPASKHHAPLYRFFSHSRWTSDALGHVLFHLLLPFMFVGPMSMDAALYDLPIQPSGRGRKRLKGNRLPSPANLANTRAVPWTERNVSLYGKSTTILVKSQRCLWYTVTGIKLIRMVLTRDPKGRIDDRAYFCTDPDRSIKQILKLFACRWKIEVAFRNAKQFMGLEDPQNGWWRRDPEDPAPSKKPGPNPHPSKGQAGIIHTFSMVLTAYAMTIFWYLHHGNYEKDVQRVRTEAPWYRHKQTPSFMDRIASVRRELWAHRISSHPVANRLPQKTIDLVPHWLLAAA